MDVVAKTPASDGPAGERVYVHDAADTTAAVLNANLDVIMEAAAATGVPTLDSSAGIPATAPVTAVRTLPHNRRGRFDESGNPLTLALIAVASVSQKGGDKNIDNFKRLYVANDDGRGWQSLLLFDLAIFTKSFGPVMGVVTLSVCLASGSDSDAATFKKMACGNWTKCGVTCDNVASDDGTGDNESKISFADNLEGSV